MESALIVLLDKIPSWVIWFIPVAWLAPRVFGLRIVRKTHGGVKFTTPIRLRSFLNLNEWSLLPPFMPSGEAKVAPVSPGICLYSKLLSDIEIYPTARQTTNLQYQALVTNDKYSIAVSAIVAYEVTDLVRAFGETAFFKVVVTIFAFLMRPSQAPVQAYLDLTLPSRHVPIF